MECRDGDEDGDGGGDGRCKSRSWVVLSSLRSRYLCLASQYIQFLATRLVGIDVAGWQREEGNFQVGSHKFVAQRVLGE